MDFDLELDRFFDFDLDFDLDFERDFDLDLDRDFDLDFDFDLDLEDLFFRFSSDSVCCSQVVSPGNSVIEARFSGLSYTQASSCSTERKR